MIFIYLLFILFISTLSYYIYTILSSTISSTNQCNGDYCITNQCIGYNCTTGNAFGVQSISGDCYGENCNTGLCYGKGCKSGDCYGINCTPGKCFDPTCDQSKTSCIPDCIAGQAYPLQSKSYFKDICGKVNYKNTTNLPIDSYNFLYKGNKPTLTDPDNITTDNGTYQYLDEVLSTVPQLYKNSKCEYCTKVDGIEICNQQFPNYDGSKWSWSNAPNNYKCLPTDIYGYTSICVNKYTEHQMVFDSNTNNSITYKCSKCNQTCTKTYKCLPTQKCTTNDMDHIMQNQTDGTSKCLKCNNTCKIT